MEVIEILKKYVKFLEDKLYDEGYEFDDIKVLRYEFAIKLSDEQKKYL